MNSTTDTAHQHWNTEWQETDSTSKWVQAEPEVMAHIEGLEGPIRVLDLGSGVGRHALEYARAGHEVSALDAAEAGIWEVTRRASAEGLDIDARLGMMDKLPFEDQSFHHVLSWNVIYHGDESVLTRTIAEIARVLVPGGTFHGTMLSKRILRDRTDLGKGREISRNTWVFDGGGDKAHPHYFCNAAELCAVFRGFEPLTLVDREHETPGSWHWHLLAERQA
ncbi:MAG: class I SAM-dependent methyltransferase [Pseudomonadota bacterium]